MKSRLGSALLAALIVTIVIAALAAVAIGVVSLVVMMLGNTGFALLGGVLLVVFVFTFIAFYVNGL